MSNWHNQRPLLYRKKYRGNDRISGYPKFQNQFRKQVSRNYIEDSKLRERLF